MRASWSGYLVIGSLPLPMQLVRATEESGSGLHKIHIKCGSRIQYRSFCPACNEIVPSAETCSGVEGPNGFVPVQKAEAESTNMTLLGFTTKPIHPHLLQEPYYLIPKPDKKSKSSELYDIYWALARAMTHAKVIAIATVVSRNLTKYYAIMPSEPMTAFQLRFPDDIREAPITRESEPSQQAIALMTKLIELNTKEEIPLPNNPNRAALAARIEAALAAPQAHAQAVQPAQPAQPGILAQLEAMLKEATP